MTTKLATVTDEVANIVRQTLEEKFGDTLVFDPIEVIPKVDLDGDEYLHIYMVYDGDVELLDTAWTLSFHGLIRRSSSSLESRVFRVSRSWKSPTGKRCTKASQRECGRPDKDRRARGVRRGSRPDRSACSGRVAPCRKRYLLRSFSRTRALLRQHAGGLDACQPKPTGLASSLSRP